ncbi:MAG TPA: hypothetical protein VK638_26845 [Edaphobacter sp.]|nr:hypothetical protein [Edaphobacter sp.]
MDGQDYDQSRPGHGADRTASPQDAHARLGGKVGASGGFNSKTMMVMMTANAPSENASTNQRPLFVQACILH